MREFNERELADLKGALKSLKRKKRRSGKELPKAEAELYRRLGATYASQARQVDFKVADEKQRKGLLLQEAEFYRKAGEAYEKAYNLSGQDSDLQNSKRLYEEAKVPDKQQIKSGQEGGLVGRVSMILAIGGFILAIFFLSFNFTGAVIGNLTNSTSNIIGVISLIVGVIAGFLYFKKK